VTLSARLARLERQRPACCGDAVTLLRLADGDPPPEPEVCPRCGRPMGRVLLHEVIVQRLGGVLLFTSPDWARFVPPDEVARLLQQQQQGDTPAWDDAEARARQRQAAGEAPYYVHTPGDRTP
jgi:hypothetical protein